MRTPKLKLAVIAVAAAFAADAAAIDFLQTYRLARQNDPTFASARSGLEAGLEKLPQGRALLLPVINGTANTNWNDGENRNTGNPDIQQQRLQRYPDAAALPLAEHRPVQAVGVPGAAVRGPVRAGDAGPHRARGAGLLRGARRAGQPRLHRRQQDRDRRAARAGEAQLRGRDRDHHRHERGAGALRPRGRPGDRGPERARGRGARPAADHRPDPGQADAAQGGGHDHAGAERDGRVGERGAPQQLRRARQRGGVRDRHARDRTAARGPLPDSRRRREQPGQHHPEPRGGLRPGQRDAPEDQQNFDRVAVHAADLRRRLGALPHPRGGRAAREGAAGPRGEQARRGVQRAPVVPQRHQRPRAGEGARAGARFERDLAAVEPRRLRGRRADQHRRAERAAAGVPDQARPRARALRHDPERAAAQVGRRLARRERCRAGQRAARLRPGDASRADPDPAAKAADRHVRSGGPGGDA